MKIKNLLSHDFRHTAINQVWRLISGPLLLLLIPLYLSAEAQGYWYTFVSLAALAVFADMGFSAVLMMFSAHEFAHLKFNEDATLNGDARHLGRLATLWVFAMKWSVVMAFVVFPLVLTVGVYILSTKNSQVEWVLPWIIYGSASVLVFINSMLLSFIEGCDSVGSIQKIRFRIGVINVAATLLFLTAGLELYALALSLALSSVAGGVLVLASYRNTFVQLFGLAKTDTHQWLREILPLIWRYSISWVSGYFIVSFFAPMAFKFYTPVEAGQVGLSVAVCAAIFGISNMWITVVTPRINIYVARKEYSALDVMFFRHLAFAGISYIIGIAILYAVVGCLDIYFSLASRLVDPTSLALLAIGWFFQLVITGLAVYMRAFKREPLVIPSVLNGLHVGLGTLLICIYLPFKLFFFGFFSAYLWALPWVVYVFVKYRRSRELYAA